jgi:hypothetical protein
MLRKRPCQALQAIKLTYPPPGGHLPPGAVGPARSVFIRSATSVVRDGKTWLYVLSVSVI